MGRTVAIDLGTTYCAVAISEERTEPGFMSLPGCPGCSLILDELKRRVTPSVVAENERGEIVVGYRAKGRAGQSPVPIMFAKRAMGEDIDFPLDKQGTLGPEEVSTHILRHIKQVAEARLQETVDEAVITVPAYFSLRAKQLTERAGEAAGMKVAQIAQEPVAAALTYFATDPRDRLRIMTYDLGGGTFDVAILEKRDGTITSDSILAFDGDRYLGGYDFDQKLAFWMIDRLNAQGYDLGSEDPVTFAKLMVFAERAKIALSGAESHEIQEINTGITDRQGNPLVIELGITREEFERMIGGNVDYTLDICRRAMTEKPDKPLRAEEIDEIIMVGGSSRIPLISRRLEEEFGKKPRLLEPDLCVALGAAIIAKGIQGTRVPYLTLDQVPAATDLIQLAVSGTVSPGKDLADVAGCTVRLRATDASYDAQRSTSSEGRFLFDGVALLRGGEREFVLSVVAPSGDTLVEHRFTVRQTEEGDAEGGLMEVGARPFNVLSKPIYVMTTEGPLRVAPERTVLPFENMIAAQTADQTGTIRIRIMEGANALGEIRMTEIPTTLPVGSDIDITVNIQENYQVHAKAYVPSLAREQSVVIDIPVPPQRSREELKSELDQAELDAEDALSAAGVGVAFDDAKANRLENRLGQCREMLANPRAEPAAIQDCLDEIHDLIRAIREGWRPQPPRAVFDAKAAEIEQLVKQVVREKPETASDGYDKRLEAICQEAEAAYASQNEAGWADSYQKLVRLMEELKGQLSQRSGGGGGAPPDPNAYLLDFAQRLADLEQEAKDRGRYLELQEEFEEAAAALKAISPQAPDAMSQIRDWYFSKYGELHRRVRQSKPSGLPKPRKVMDSDARGAP